MKTMHPQRSDWSVASDTVLERQISSNKNKEKKIDSVKTLSNVNKQNPENYIKIKSQLVREPSQHSLWKSFCVGLILGVLTAGLILAVVIALWLTSGQQTLTTKTTSTDISIAINSTTRTTATVSTTTSTATISNLCIGDATYSTQLLYLIPNSTLPWTEYSFNYTAPSINSATIVFSLRNDPAFWYLDDVSVTNSSGNQLLLNGGFEQGNLSGWTYCNPNLASYSGSVTSSMSHSGSYSYMDGSVGASDYLSQTFTVVPNNIYSVKFWLTTSSTNLTFALVTITS